MDVSNSEIRTLRQAARGMREITDLLATGALDKVVIADRTGRFRAVVITVDDYEALTRDLEELARDDAALRRAVIPA